MISDKWRTVFRVIHEDFSKEQYDTREEALAAARDGDRIMKLLASSGAIRGPFMRKGISLFERWFR